MYSLSSKEPSQTHPQLEEHDDFRWNRVERVTSRELGREAGEDSSGDASRPSPQNVYYTSSQQLHLGVLSPTIDDDDNKCLVEVNSRPRLLECSYASNKHLKLTWTFTQVTHAHTQTLN